MLITFWGWPPLSDIGETNSECVLGCMRLCRILRDALAPRVQAKDHSSSNLKLIILLFGITSSITISYQLLSFVASTRHATFNTVCLLEVGRLA
jgi:hypothetical protein